MKRAPAILALLIAGCLSPAYGDAAEPIDALDPPGEPWWYVQIRDAGAPGARIAMVSQEPPPF